MNHWMDPDVVFRTLCGIARFDDVPDADTITFPGDVDTPAAPTCPGCIAEIRRIINGAPPALRHPGR